MHLHPMVLEAAAVAVPDRRLGELVAVVVFLKAPDSGGDVGGGGGMRVTEEDLIKHARKQ